MGDSSEGTSMKMRIWIQGFRLNMITNLTSLKSLNS